VAEAREKSNRKRKSRQNDETSRQKREKTKRERTYRERKGMADPEKRNEKTKEKYICRNERKVAEK